MTTSWLIHQLSDSAFPAGGFAHSYGLEAAAGWGALDDANAGLRMHEWLTQLGHGALPFVSSAHEQPGRTAEIGLGCEAFLTNHVARRASKTAGEAFLETCARIFSGLDEIRQSLRASTLLHHPVVYGAVLSTLGISLDETQRLFLSQGLRGALSAAVRLNVLGTHQAQALLFELAASLEHTLRLFAPLRAEDTAQISPLLDLFQSTHDRLYSRLFQS